MKKVDTATLVDPLKAAAVAQRLFDYYQNRYTDEAKDIGKILQDIDTLLERMALSFFYSGDVYSGEGV